jgi:hypothetical protein
MDDTIARHDEVVSLVTCMIDVAGDPYAQGEPTRHEKRERTTAD